MFAPLPTVLEFRNVTLQPKDSVPVIDNVSFSVHEGEIFGIAGVSGNGQDELCDVCSPWDHKESDTTE